MQGDRATAPSQKPKKARKVSPPRGKGPLAPKPQGVFAAPVKAPSVKAKPAPKPKVQKPTPAALDVLPSKKGQNAKPYRPPVAKTVVRKAAKVRAAAQHETRDTKGDEDRLRAAAFLAAHPEILKPPKPKPHGSLLATITGAAKAGSELGAKIAPFMATANMPNVQHDEHIKKALSNAPKDTAELVTTTPTSLVKLGDTAIHDPAKVPGMLAQPYKDLVKDPQKAFEEHPVSTFLMLAPAVKVPGKVVGRGLRAAGKQSLEHAPATLPGTALKEARPASRDAVVNAVQTRKVKGKPAPEMSTAEVQRRVDEFHDFAQQKTQQIQGSAHRTAKQQAKALPKDQRKPHVQAQVEGARAGSRRTVDQRFVKEFGSTYRVGHIDSVEAPKPGTPEFKKVLEKYNQVLNLAARGGTAGEKAAAEQAGTRVLAAARLENTPAGIRPIKTTKAILKPRKGTEGHLHDTRAEAELVAASLARDPKITWEPQVMPAGNKFGVVPKDAKTRLNKQRAVGTSPATMAKVMRRSRGALTQAVLPLSTKWLLGQGVEAGLRSAVAGAGPADLLRFNRVVKKMNTAKAGSGDELLMRVSGGQFGLTGTAREFAQGKRSLADEFAGTSMEKVGNAASKVGGTLPARAVKAGWGRYTNVMLDSVNGVLENTARKAMAGQAIKTAGLMDKRVLTGLTDKALEDAARGLHGTENQVALGRAVDRMYGQYQKFSPDKRSLLLHWTPFLPWYLNTAKFLFKVLPADHPIKTALLADVGVATEQWRKDHGLSLRGGVTKPAWMLGGYPSKTGVIPVGRFTPFGAGTDVPGAVASLTLPQLLGPIKNAGGVDWKWQQLKMPGYKGKPFTPSQKAARALVTAVESQVPGVSQVAKATGLERKYVDHKTGGDSPRQSIAKMLNPLAAIPNTGAAAVTPSSGKAGALPAGVSQRELDQLVRDARKASSQPQVSQAEIDALLRAAGR